MTAPAPAKPTDRRADLKLVWVVRFGVLIIRALALTWRVRMLNPQVLAQCKQAGRVIYPVWHGQLLPLLWTHRGQQLAVIVSEHRDGEIIAGIARALGFVPVRGSTTRGAARALLSATREVAAGRDLAITVDGPRGPAGVVAPGVMAIAQRTNAILVPTAAGASRAWRLRSWDRFMIPKPFARVNVVYGEPVRVRADSLRDAAGQVEVLRRGLEQAAATAAAEA